MQVFFIRDGAQFPDLVHAAKASPLNNLAEAWRFADFLSFHPESMNIATYIFDDYVGQPLPAEPRCKRAPVISMPL